MFLSGIKGLLPICFKFVKFKLATIVVFMIHILVLILFIVFVSGEKNEAFSKLHYGKLG